MITVSDLVVFAWQPDILSRGSKELRDAAMAYRLRGQALALAAMEDSLPPAFFYPFDLEVDRIEPEVNVCASPEEERLFDYLVWGQSMPADIKNFRNTKVLVHDRGQAVRRPLGAILLKSPMYFDGARDAHLGWPALFDIVDGERKKSQAAVDLRNKALKSIYNISVCMLAPPYAGPGMGKLIASLCFSPEIVGYIETKFGQPVLGLTTTGGWGANATQYDNLRLAAQAAGGLRPLYTRTHGARPSLNFPVHLFSDQVLHQAMEVLRADPVVKARNYAAFATDPDVAKRAFCHACRLVGVPIRATASNCIAHYFGSISDACTDALRTPAGIDAAPAMRSIPVDVAVAAWRAHIKPAMAPQAGAQAAHLSLQAT